MIDTATIQRVIMALHEQTGRVLSLKSGEGDYGLSVRRNVYALWSGKLDRDSFVSEMEATIDRGLRRAWIEGLREVGVKPGDMSSDAELRIGTIVIDQYNYLGGLADWITENNKDQGGKLGELQDRVALWSGRYDAVREEAHLYGNQEQRYEWVYGDTEHCSDCQRLNGTVATASDWLAYPLHPQDYNLECHGFRCQCRLVPTDKPVTEGGIPLLH